MKKVKTMSWIGFFSLVLFYMVLLFLGFNENTFSSNKWSIFIDWFSDIGFIYIGLQLLVIFLILIVINEKNIKEVNFNEKKEIN